MNIFNQFDLAAALETTQERGYLFIPNLVDAEALEAMKSEANGLEMVEGDHVRHPINKGAANEVRQLHQRLYKMLDDVEVPVASLVCKTLAEVVAVLKPAYPELEGWLPNEIGYQKYRDGRDWISPHRDRRSDRLLSMTFTLEGKSC